MSKSSGKVAVVTEASKGIGASIAEHLAASELTPKDALLRFYEAEANYMKAFQENGVASFEEMREILAPDVILHQSLTCPLAETTSATRGMSDGRPRWARSSTSSR